MKFLFLVRHAKSSWDNASMSDFDRPLNPRGIKNAGEMAARLSGKIDKIDAFISSPAVRAKTTAITFIETLGLDESRLILDPDLYLAPPSFFNELISEVNNDYHSIAIFSHNPGITDFANTLTTVVKTDNIPTCGIFAVKAAIDNWSEFPTAKKEFLFFDYPKLAN